MAGIDRRTFIKRSAAAAAGGAMLAGPFQGFVAHAAGASHRHRRAKWLGPISPVADLRDGVVRLALPDGFTYRSFGAAGDIMGDGTLTPGRQDGMAAFRGPRGTIRLMRNHEVRGEGTPIGPAGDAHKAYDGNTLGGVSTLSIDRRSRELLDDWVSLTGTSVNCAGGPTPWRTWISAEETVNGPDLGPDFTGTDGPASFQRHGYLFEVDSRWGPGESAAAVPIRSAGRFAHEAVAYVPHVNALFQTEDNFAFPSGIYRYTPPDNAMHVHRISDGGTLEMLRVIDQPDAELGLVQPAGASYDVDWVTIGDPDWDFGPGPTDNDIGIQEIGRQGFEQGAARFARPEGIWRRGHSVYFACTRGGATQLEGNPGGEYGNGYGQIWKLDTRRNRLRLVYESPGPDTLDLPDNLTISPRGNIVICEDGATDNYIRCLTRDGMLSDFAQNLIEGEERQEFAGVCFSPDGKTMFVNIQYGSGLTFAIWRERGNRRFI